MNKMNALKNYTVIKNHTYEYEINQTKCMIDIHLEKDGRGKLQYKVYVTGKDGVIHTSSADPSKSKAVSKAIKKYSWITA
ncbi:hypothetical protein J9317_16745 [Metabacillus sp. KIGAM252]|uniref:PepSY domain-containing protein n=1 Tax=Metabacillus flavus TaxID=2823519 RepID=A0ABS5LI49_9BACI|nr:hypothetical protein [Metabacillus flavus]MBS2970397.1 hypothetical protein [Metabacillus flavus]